MIVAFYRNVAVAPAVTFKFPYKVHAGAENKDFVRLEIFLYFRYSRKQIFIHVRIDRYPTLVKEFGNAFNARESFLICRRVDKRIYPPVVTPAPAYFVRNAFYRFGVIIYISFRLVMCLARTRSGI